MCVPLKTKSFPKDLPRCQGNDFPPGVQRQASERCAAKCAAVSTRERRTKPGLSAVMALNQWNGLREHLHDYGRKNIF